VRTVLDTPPELEPVSLDEAKLHLRVDISPEDDLIETLITAARQRVEVELRRTLISQTWSLYLDDWPADEVIQIPNPPLIQMRAIAYVDSNGVSQSLTYYDWLANPGTPGRIAPVYGTSWPSVRSQLDAIVVQYDAGYGELASDVPACIRQAILLLVGDWYENREETVIGTISSPLPTGVKYLLATEQWGQLW
jgi:uncharacterized phiE125 gp8 family phage protein